MDVIQVTTSLKTNGVCTNDWIGVQVVGGALYAYDPSNIIMETNSGLTRTERLHLNETKRIHHRALEQLSQL